MNRVCLQEGSRRDFDPIFAAMVQLRAGMLVIGADPFFFGHRDQIAALAIRHRMPAIFFLREFATVGGLMSYGPIVTESYARLASTPAGLSRARSRQIYR